jgi:hypothetical protein
MSNLPQLEWYDNEALGYSTARTAVGIFTAYKDKLRYHYHSMPITYTQHEDYDDYKFVGQKYFVEECLGLEMDKEYSQEIVDLATLLSKELDCSGDEWNHIFSTYTYEIEGISKVVYIENVGGADDKALIVMLHGEDVNIPFDNKHEAIEHIELSIVQRIVAKITAKKQYDEQWATNRVQFNKDYPLTLC